MNTNSIKERLQRSETTVGVLMVLDHPGVAQVIADAGFDWIIFDTEHGHYSSPTLRTAMDAIGRTQVSPIVRVAGNDPILIKLALDLGPEGIVVPMVNSRQEARLAVAACKYPPTGIRGVGLGRATHYGGRFKEYIAQANDNILIVLQIEHVDAIKNIDEIVRVEGIDCLFIGVWDLSASMGIPGQVDDPQVLDAVDKVLKAGRDAGIPVGMWCKNEEHAANMAKRGMQFLAYTTDCGLLASAAENSLKEIHKNLANMI